MDEKASNERKFQETEVKNLCYETRQKKKLSNHFLISSLSANILINYIQDLFLISKFL